MAFIPTPSNPSAVPSFTTAELIEQFLEAKIAAGLSAKTIITYSERLRRFNVWLGDRPITRPALRSYLADLQSQGYASSTVASYFRDVRIFCQWCTDEEYLPGGLTRNLAPRVKRRPPPSYTAAHIAQLLAVCDDRDRALIVTLLDTGLRASEVCSLDRSSIDTDGRFVVVGKGSKQRTGWLEPYTVEQIAVYLATRTDSDPALWVGYSGERGRLKPNGLYQMLRRRVEQAGLRGDVRRLVHSMRVSYAVSFIRRGGDLASLSMLLGHSSLDMTKHYAALVEDDLAMIKRRTNPLAAMLGENPT